MIRYIYFLFYFFIIIPKITFGYFLSEPMGYDMYKKIDSGIFDLELKYLEKELRGGDMNLDIADDLNNRAKQNGLEECFGGDITVQEMKDIYDDEKGTKILSKLLEKCFDENNSIGTEDFNKYLGIARESFSQNSKKAKNKVDSIFKIGRIGMYSDGIEENSPFDLMLDLEDINNIIFEEYIPYKGVNNFDLGVTVDGILSGLSPEEAYNLGKYNDNTEKIDDTNTTINPNLLASGVCLTNNTDLNTKDFLNILKENNDSVNDDKNSDEDGSGENGNKTKKSTGYKRLNDNSIWPCDDFFCILIDFVIYNHKLLGGSTNLSIEGLLKRSNNHLKKFVSTSLIQSKMTINNFEIGLKDLNLPDLFHVGIQVSYKPVPIINVDKSEKDILDDEFRYENLLFKYYKNFGLDYYRSNDMKNFLQKESELKSILDSQELETKVSKEKFGDYKSFVEEIKKENDYISKTTVDKKIIEEGMRDFYYKYAELESFSRALMEYTFGVKGIIKKMNEIPQGG